MRSSFSGVYRGLYKVLLIIFLTCPWDLANVITGCDDNNRRRAYRLINPHLNALTRNTSAVIQFDGRKGVVFSISSEGKNEQISLEFRTRKLTQSIVYVVLDVLEDHTTSHPLKTVVSLHSINGSLFIAARPMNKPVGISQDADVKVSTECISDYNTCSDTYWHKLKITFAKQKVNVYVDEQNSIERNFPQLAGHLSIREIHLGKPSPSLFPPSNSADQLQQGIFRGCMRHITYSSRKSNMLLTDVPPPSRHIKTTLSKNLLHSNCRNALLVVETANPPGEQMKDNTAKEFVNFVRPGSYLLASGWSVVSSGTLSFKFRTIELNGLILYSSSISETDVTWVSYSPHFAIPGEGGAGYDSFALELRGGHLVSVINMGSGTFQMSSQFTSDGSTTNRRLNDGMIHQVQVKFHEGNVQINVDNKVYASHTAAIKTYKFLNLNGKFYIGGLPETIRFISDMISPEVLSARLSMDFKGCFGSFTVDNQAWDLDLESRACWADGYVQRGCNSPATNSKCRSSDCSNSGRCTAGWMQNSCDCGDTDFEGDDCTKEPTVLSFNGHQWLRVDFGPLPIQSAAESVLVRFSTRQQFALLFTTSSVTTAASDLFELRLESGHPLLLYDFGVAIKKYKHVIYVSDKKWHTVRIQRYERSLNFTVDGFSQLADLPETEKFLSHGHLILGQSELISNNSPVDGFPRRFLNRSFVNEPRFVFIGHVMKFEFNGINFIQLAEQIQYLSKSTVWSMRVEVTAHKTTQEPLLEFPLKFNSYDSYVDITLPVESKNFFLEFWIKVNKNFGIILCYEVDNKEIFGLELVNGDFHLIYLDELKSRRTARSKKSRLLNDSRWHRIKVIRTEGLHQTLVVQVDEEAVYASLKIPEVFSDRKIFLAGIPNNHSDYQPFRRLFQTTSGFAGCIASVSVNLSDYGPNQHILSTSPESTWQLISVHSHKQQLISWHNAEPGCHIRSLGAPRNHSAPCLPNTCLFQGRCVQQLHAARCDCSMTTYSGDRCTIPATTIHLHKKPPTYLTFEFNPVQNTTRDQLAFGIQATHRGSLRLLHIKGSGVSPDFIEVFIFPLKTYHVLAVRYNMGDGQQTVTQPHVDIADGRYHIVQFIRDGWNSMLRIDLKHEVTNIPSGRQGKHFNKLKTIQVGSSEVQQGKGKPISVSSEAFEGHLSGLNFNGIWLFRVLSGYVMPGIHLSQSQNLKLSQNFRPNIEHILMKKRELDTFGHSVANDMQNPFYIGNDAQEEVDKTYQTNPLVFSQVECVESRETYNSKTCVPLDEDGIVKPVIEFGGEINGRIGG
ncbi:unnamed protein product [Dicrocoelium dendriticum]|nr:unnamed protein product [Dicrocoelium dendriticum]